MRNNLKHQFMIILWALAVLLKGLDVCLLFSKIRSYYVILIESYKESKAFLAIVGYICTVFAIVSSFITIGDEDNFIMLELGFIVFQDSLGGFEAPDKDEISDNLERMARWVIFILFLIVTNIIGINSLIAIIGDSYERVQLDRAFYDASEKFGILNKLNEFYLFLNHNKKMAAKYVYIHIVRYSKYSISNKVWKGRIQHIREVVQDGVSTITKQNDQMRSEVDMIKNQMNYMNWQI